ncbi:MAG: Wzz/FepE/Etk N-terminal domain-containing protein [Pseudotabrizicola sp.]|uniref:GumC family protein n=1 Tax=Pseudotabrizicola sp. TaxID=2939647 RepID=UPI00272F7B9D|nr:Wzz/FepE/Etk N-terminal domain-containing protein [Pseudotabrizicola sp.]MDP2081856.1 Wzz/FepE/Etk N-terminal domain-containing protein [Pseudotabrizicola sp.]MDZ7573854.1 Wzz/FepE/Etk N-terminal domain-containing protein [Pseudotabrizicola sp.]
MGPIQTIEDLIGLVRRRYWIILAVALIGTIFAAVYAKTRPNVFESAAVLQVELPMVTDGGQAPALPVSTLQLLTSIEQRLTTRENMITLIERHSLFADAPGMSVEDKVDAMRRSVSFQTVTGPSGALSALIVSAQAGDAEDAARIANDLAQSVLDLGSEGKRATAEASFAFFKEQENRLWQQMTELEAEVATYRDANRSALPGVREARQDEITQLETSLRALDQETTGLQSEDAQVRALPTMRATDRRRLEDIGQRLSVLAAQRTPLAARKAALEATLGDTAEVERALSAYERQLRQLQDQYTVVSQRMAEAETAQSLASRQQTERFAMLERAITPDYPVGSGGKKIAIAGLIASTGMGFFLAFLLDLINPVIRTAAQMERELNIRPIVSIPEVPHSNRKSFGSKTIKSLIESEAGRLPAMVGLRSLVILGGAALILLIALVSML